MDKFVSRFAAAFSPETGGAPAAGTPAAGTPAAAPAAGAPAAAAPSAGAPLAAPPAAYWPEGLDPSLKGADDKATLDNLGKTIKGYRDRDAQRLVPETAEGYLDLSKLGDYPIDPKNQPYIEALKTDPAFKSMAEAARSNGIGQKALLDVYQAGLSAMAASGLLEPLVDVEKERLALVPDAAKNLPKQDQDQAVQRRLNDNFDFNKLMVQTRGLPQEVAQNAELMLGDTALGQQFFEWVRAQVQGSAAGPGAYGSGPTGDTPESLRKDMAALDRNDPHYAQKHTDLMSRYQKAYPG